MPCPLKAAFDQAHPTFYLPVAAIGTLLAVCAPYLYRGATKKFDKALFLHKITRFK